MSVTQTGTTHYDVNTGAYHVGQDPTVPAAGTGTLTVDGGSDLEIGALNPVAEGALLIGTGDDADGTVTVTGSGSALSVVGDGDGSGGAEIQVGTNGGTGALVISDGGSFAILDPSTTPLNEDYEGSEGIAVGRGAGSSGMLSVDAGHFSLAGGAPAFSLGRDGGVGLAQFANGSTFTMTALTGGEFSSVDLQIGRQNGASGTMTFSGSTGTITAHEDGSADIKIGRDTGSGELSLTAGSSLTVAGGAQGASVVAGLSGGQGTLNVSSSTLNVTSATSGAFIGIGVVDGNSNHPGRGTGANNFNDADVTVQGNSYAGFVIGASTQSVVTASQVLIDSASGNAEFSLADGEDTFAYVSISAGSDVTVSAEANADIVVGANGGHADLEVLDSTLVASADERVAFVVGNGHAGDDIALVSTVNVNGATAAITLTPGQDETDGAEIGASIGINGGTGVLNISNGATFEIVDNSTQALDESYEGSEYLGVGRGEGSSGTVSVDSGTLSMTGGAPAFAVGRDGASGTVSFVNGSTFTITAMTGGENADLAFQIGRQNGAEGSVTFDASTGTLTAHPDSTADIRVGRDTGTGELILTNGFELTLSGGRGAALTLGLSGGTGELEVRSSTLSISGSEFAGLGIGVIDGNGNHPGAGTGYAVIDDSTVSIGSNDYANLFVAAGEQTVGSLDVTGSSVSVSAGSIESFVGAGQASDGDMLVVESQFSLNSTGTADFGAGTNSGSGAVVVTDHSTFAVSGQEETFFNFGGGLGGSGELRVDNWSAVTVDNNGSGDAVMNVGTYDALGSVSVNNHSTLSLQSDEAARLNFGHFGGFGTLSLNSSTASIDGAEASLSLGAYGGRANASLENSFLYVGGQQLDPNDVSTQEVGLYLGGDGSFDGEDSGTGTLVVRNSSILFDSTVRSNFNVGSGGASIGTLHVLQGSVIDLGVNSGEGVFKVGSRGADSATAIFDGTGTVIRGIDYGAVGHIPFDDFSVEGGDATLIIRNGARLELDAGNPEAILNIGAGGVVGGYNGTIEGNVNIVGGSAADFRDGRFGSFTVEGDVYLEGSGNAIYLDVRGGANDVLHVTGSITSTSNLQYSLNLNVTNGYRFMAGEIRTLVTYSDGDGAARPTYTVSGQHADFAYYGGLLEDRPGETVFMALNSGASGGLGVLDFGNGSLAASLTYDANANNGLAAGGALGAIGGRVYNADSFLGSDLNDTLTITGAANRVFTLDGRDGNDVLTGGAGTDALIGGAGNDTFVLGGGNDSVNDSAGTDTITSTATRSLASYATIEHLTLLGTGNINGTGNGLNNTVTGNSGANILTGGGGSDTLIGGGGNDTYVLENASDTVNDNGGTDTITSTITRSLASYATIENLTLLGGSAANGSGNGLANTITGNTAANVLNGALGKDTLNGGGGNDTFVFNTAPNTSSNRDTIVGFSNASGNNDVFHLENSVFTKLAAGNLNAANFKLGTAAGDSNDYLIYNKTKGILYYDADGNGKGAAIEVAYLSNMAALTAADFFIV